MVYNNDEINGEILNLEEVGLKIHLTCPTAIKEWLKTNDVKLHHFGSRKNMIYVIDLEIALLTPKAVDLFLNQNETWEQDLLPYCRYNPIYIDLLRPKVNNFFQF
jgi:hypothetical protein